MPVELPGEPEEARALWEALLDLADEMPVPWVLIGAQMVALHAWKAEGEAPRLSRAGDVMVDVRLKPAGTRELAEHLAERGFEIEQPSLAGVGVEFRRDGVAIDILAPDNLGSRVDLETLHHTRTVSVPGGTQALDRMERIDVRLGHRIGTIPVPNLLGALVLKLKAIGVDDVPDAQKADVGVLLSLHADWSAIAASLEPAERKLLERYPEFGDPTSSPYNALERAREAATTYRRLLAK